MHGAGAVVEREHVDELLGLLGDLELEGLLRHGVGAWTSWCWAYIANEGGVAAGAAPRTRPQSCLETRK